MSLGIKLQQPQNYREFKWKQITHKNEIKNTFCDPTPTVLPKQLSKQKIKRRTGFKSETAMLKYIMIVCIGNIKIMTTTESHLTWFQEWMCFFEIMWGKTHTRVEDLTGKYWVEKNKTFYTIINAKLDVVLSCWKSWPTYASFEEDATLCKEKWDKNMQTVGL